MNIFFLSMNSTKLANMYCDQHVIKILLEICQMLYTAWFFSDEMDYVSEHAPFNKNKTTRGYKPAHKGHPMTLWISSCRENYTFAAEIAMSLALEYNKRFGKIHACSKHALWLHENIPSRFELRESDKAYYASEDIKSGLTRIPECMPDEYKDPSIIKSYEKYYVGDKLKFARFTRV
jgi:hypothetical protein